MHTNPSRRFGAALVGLARRWRRHLDERLAADGLSDAAWVPLVHLESHGDGLRQNELAAAVGLDSSSLVRLLDRLEGQGLILRVLDKADRRVRRIRLTEAGRAAVADIRKRLWGFENGLLADVSEAELAAALSVFDRIEARLAGEPGEAAA
jgi:MarR family transcriptional regulator, transcriptional regulator for hemolysin